MKRARLKKRPRRSACLRAAALALSAAVVAIAASSAGAGAPGGLVRYDRPVYHNGKRVLWHGAWRGGAGRRFYVRAEPAKAEIPPSPAPAGAAVAATGAEAAANTPAARSTPLKPFAILADPGDLVASRMARDFVEVVNDQGGQGRAIVGSTAPTGVLKVMRVDMADFAIVTLDSLAVSVKYQSDWSKRVPLVAPLAPETVEVISSKDVKVLSDLAGKSVSFGDPDGTTGITAKLLFQRVGVTVNPIYEPLTDALAALAAGKRDAVVVLGGRDAHALDGFGGDGRFHLVAIPRSPQQEQAYAPGRVPASDRPNLVAANDSVETVAEPMALVALDAQAGSPRAEALGRVARVFFDKYDSILADGRDQHWREVNLAAGLAVANADWPRLAGAQGWIDDRKTSSDASLDAFRTAAKTAEASGGPKADDSDRLYDSLTRWRSLMQ